MKKLFILLLLFYPILFLFDRTQGTNYFIGYHNLLLSYWPLILAAVISYYLVKRDKYYFYDEADKVRHRIYFGEVARWRDTPYIPPIMLMYLKNPPTSFSPFLYDFVNNTFYRTVVNDFRDKVYVLSDFDSFEPDPRESYIEVVGLRNISRILFYLGSTLAMVYYWLFIGNNAFLSGWEVFTIPLMVVALYRSYHLIRIYSNQNYTSLDHQYELNDVKRNILWREAFPDTEVGKTFIRAYYVEMERRARYDSQLRGRMVSQNMEEWNNTNFAPYPYPAQTIPEWENEYAAVIESKQQALSNGSTKIIQLRKSP